MLSATSAEVLDSLSKILLRRRIVESHQSSRFTQTVSLLHRDDCRGFIIFYIILLTLVLYRIRGQIVAKKGERIFVFCFCFFFLILFGELGLLEIAPDGITNIYIDEELLGIDLYRS